MSQKHGNVSEIEFISRAVAKGLSVSRPVFVEKYDCLIDNGKAVLKIQIKSTNYNIKTSYQISLLKGSSKKDKYEAGDCDFFAVHIREKNVWYIIPFGDSAAHLYLHPDQDNCRYDRFKEAWYLLHAKCEQPTNEIQISL